MREREREREQLVLVVVCVVGVGGPGSHRSLFCINWWPAVKTANERLAGEPPHWLVGGVRML